MDSWEQLDPAIMKKILLAATFLATGLFAGTQADAYTVTFFGPSQWGASDATIGVSGYAIEDFEDVNLVSGLQVQMKNVNQGNYGPTSTLPKTFDPSFGAGDQVADAFVVGLWDGTHNLLNNDSPIPTYSGSYCGCGDIVLGVAAGTSSLGFSLEQNDSTLNLLINGSLFTTIAPAGEICTTPQLGNFICRNGYFRIDAVGSDAPITSVEINNSNSRGDGWTIDHVAFARAAVPEPASLALLGAALAGLGWARRRG